MKAVVALAGLALAGLASCGGSADEATPPAAGGPSLAATATAATTPTPSAQISQVRGPVLEVSDDGSWLVEERAGSAAVVPTGRTVRVVFDPAAPPVDGNREPVAVEGLVPRTDHGGVIVIGVLLADGSLRATMLMYW